MTIVERLKNRLEEIKVENKKIRDDNPTISGKTYDLFFEAGFNAAIKFMSQNLNKAPCKTLLPTDDEFLAHLDKIAFRVPFDGSNNFYDETMIKHWKECWEYLKAFRGQ